MPDAPVINLANATEFFQRDGTYQVLDDCPSTVTTPEELVSWYSGLVLVAKQQAAEQLLAWIEALP